MVDTASLKVVDRRELAQVMVVQGAAQPGGRSQAVAHLRGCLVATPEYVLSPPGAALQWKAALFVPRLVYLSDAARAVHTRMVDLALAASGTWQLPNGKAASRWRIFAEAAQGDEPHGLDARRRKHEIRAILHARERAGAKFRGAANLVTLHGFLESLGHLQVNASTLRMRKR